MSIGSSGEKFLVLMNFVFLTKMRHDWQKLHHEDSQLCINDSVPKKRLSLQTSNSKSETGHVQNQIIAYLFCFDIGKIP